MDRLESKLAGWKAKNLSKSGRATLIKSIGLAFPIYTMQSTGLPLANTSKIKSLA